SKVNCEQRSPGSVTAEKPRPAGSFSSVVPKLVVAHFPAVAMSSLKNVPVFEFSFANVVTHLLDVFALHAASFGFSWMQAAAASAHFWTALDPTLPSLTPALSSA